MIHTIKILDIQKLTHDVKCFRCEKPAGYVFLPGQATEVSINKYGWENEARPFTFTSLNEEDYLEFIIKIYDDHPGMTNELNKLKPGEELIIRDVWGAITYKGPGYFIAGGAGITPFIAILRTLKKQNAIEGNTLFFSNKTTRDIILKEELSGILGERAIYTITDEPANGYHNGFIDESFLKTRVEDTGKHFYLCGPPKMLESMQDILSRMGAPSEKVVFEK